MLRKKIQLFFGFSRRETSGFLVLVPLLLVVLFSEPLYRALTPAPTETFVREQEILDSLEMASHSDAEYSIAKIDGDSKENEKREIHVQSFDPNTATMEGLVTLGFDRRVATRIIHYREKGGSFRKKEDLQKMYGMDSTFYRSIAPYIAIPEKSFANTYPNSKPDFKSTPLTSFDINMADTTQLKRIKGIGSVLANRIVRFRDKLGGFISIVQLNEVYGLDTVVVKENSQHVYIASNFEPQKININSSTEKELAAHPYISNAVARAIVTYRFQHGTFSKVEDIEQLKLVDHNTYNKIIPYLAVIRQQPTDTKARE